MGQRPRQPRPGRARAPGAQVWAARRQAAEAAAGSRILPARSVPSPAPDGWLPAGRAIARQSLGLRAGLGAGCRDRPELAGPAAAPL